jgi:hypothetical protein
MPIESSRQPEQTIGIRRRSTNLDGRSLTVKQMEVETLATEIQTGVQHRNGPPLDSSQSTSWSVSLGRPFFMAFQVRLASATLKDRAGSVRIRQGNVRFPRSLASMPPRDPL